MPTLAHDGITFHYEVIGDGQPVVICHGLGGDLTQARDFFGELPRYQRIFLDLRGHGETEPLGPDSGYCFATLAQDLAALVDHLGLRRFVLGGVSMGAAISTRFAVDHPRMIRALVLARPAWLTEPNPANLALFPRMAQLLKDLGPTEGRRVFEDLPEFARVREESRDTAAMYLQHFMRPKSRERCVRFLRMPADRPIRDWAEVKTLTMPALVVGNAPDPIHPIEIAHTWAERLPNATFAQIPAKVVDMDGHSRIFQEQLARFLAGL